MKIEIAALRAVATHHKVDVDTVTQVVADALTAAYASAARIGTDIEAGATVTIEDDGTVVLVSTDGTRSDVPDTFGNIAIATTRQAVIAWVRDNQRRTAVGPWATREGKAHTATVVGPGRNGELRLSIDGTAAVMPSGEQIEGENLTAGQSVTVLLLAANVDDRDGIRLTVSRRQPALVTALIHQHCPSARAGRVEIVMVARDPGSRSKVALRAPQGVDPVAEVVGAGGHRIRPVMDALGNERIDLVAHHDDPAQFAAAALTPATVAGAALENPAENRRNVVVRVPVDQLALAAGKGGANVSLAQRLTKTKIRLQPVDPA